MHLTHADGQIDRRNAVRVEHVAIAAATGRHQLRRQTQAAHGGDALLHRRIRVGQPEGGIAAINRHLCRNTKFLCGFFKTGFHVRRLGVEFGIAQAARLRQHLDPVGNDIGRHAPVDRAKVRRGFRVDAQQFHPLDRPRRNLNGADAALRCQAGVRRAPVNDRPDSVLGRCLDDDPSDLATGIQHESAFGLDLAVIEPLRAVHADFLANRQHHLQRAVRDTTRLNPANPLENRSDAGLVVAAEDRCPVRADHFTINHRLNVLARRDRVHVAAEHQRFGRLVAGQGGDQITRIAPGLFACRIELNREPHILQHLPGVGSKLSFLA